uniref:Bm9866 n=1 Tax=Brugia malayi TaxID=6279 RepID=A0A0J9XU27_BRUMA|nr:Bm9866 [Brugia malayi]
MIYPHLFDYVVNLVIFSSEGFQKTEEQELKKPIAAALRPNAPITPRECIGKKINNLNRKLRDIEILEQRIKSGVLGNPEKTQLEKIARRETITKEIDRLTVEIEKL